MMTYEEVMALLETLEEDVTVYADDEEGYIEVVIEDFRGFHKDWSEIGRKYDAVKVKAIYERLIKTCTDITDDLYKYLQFEGFTVVWGYRSYYL